MKTRTTPLTDSAPNSESLMRLLAVNSDAALHEAMRQTCAQHSFSFTVAKTLDSLVGELSVLEAIVLLGLRPQGIDPIDALRAIATVAPGSRVILVGQHDERVVQSVRRLAGQLGVQIAACLQDPVRLEVLGATLERCRPSASDPTAAELRTALQEHQLCLHFQPKFTCATNARRPVALEALVRWQHPELGLLLPGRFLRLAEEAGLMADVTDFTLTEAIHQLALWRDRQMDVTLAVNLAPRLLKDSGFPDRLLANLRQFDIPPERLMLEVQETAALVDRELCMDAFTRLRLNGVGLALDDFGTGFSSLTELYRMPFNELKIDGSYTFFDFDIDSTTIATGDKVSPNTPKHKGTLGLSYRGRQGLDVTLTAKFVDSYLWVAGVFAGVIPSSQTITASVGYQVNNNVRIHVVGTNLLDQQRFQVFGGSVIGRRVLGGITATF